MSELRVELFTPSVLRDQAEGRALTDALSGHLPSWMPHRYGWSQPLRNVYDPARPEHFWDTAHGLMFRNAVRPPGHVEYGDLRAMYPEAVVLPGPDDEGCLWFAVASIPAGVPPLGAEIIERTFQQLARDYDGIALDPE